MTEYKFTGYNNLTYTPIPDEFFDWQMQDLSGAELRVLLYIFRRTFGFKKLQDRIALSQFTNGIEKRSGEKLDDGCGLSSSSVTRAIETLTERGYIGCQFYCRCGRMVEPDELTQEIRHPEGRESFAVTVVPRTCPGCGAKLYGREERWFSLVMRERRSRPRNPPVPPTEPPGPAHGTTRNSIQERDSKTAPAKAGERPPKRRKPRTKQKTPVAVKVFRDNAHRYPAKAWYENVADVVGDKPADLTRWGQVVKAWVGLGWNPTNVKGMLEFFARGEIPTGRGKSKEPYAGIKEWVAEQEAMA